MKTSPSILTVSSILFGAVLAMIPETARAQVIHSATRPLASHILVPQARPWSSAQGQGTAQVTEVNVGVEILEQVATTTMDISLTNSLATRLEVEMVVPVPDKAALRAFTFQGAGGEPTAELIARDEARRIYDSIVAKTRDPALLEFIGYNLIRSSVFPIEPRGAQKVRLTYEHILARDGDRVDYVLPRTESIDYRVPWNVFVRIKSKQPVGTVYSPSHKLDTVRASNNSVTVRSAREAIGEPGPFRLSYLLQGEAITASLFAYPDPKLGGGYFLLLASAPAGRTAVSSVSERPDALKSNTSKSAEKGERPVLQKREVILVLDHSGSMAGEKFEQVRAAALQVLEGLDQGEAFNIVVYSDGVDSFARVPVMKNADTLKAARAYLRDLRAQGGTNIHDALIEALRMKPTHGFIPLVLFLTDGLPTVGQTSEKTIRDAAAKANSHERRIFTFGVGVDVNTPLLDRLALETRAVSTYVLPKEDVEVKVGQVFKRLSGPVLASPRLNSMDDAGKPEPPRIRDLAPVKIPDLFEGDQLVLLGQYTGDKPLTLVLDGNYFGQPRAFKFRFDLDKATTKNSFVPRLWASRKIASLTDAIRDLGADRSAAGPGLAGDPRLKELVDEIVRYSKEFGILTEYTAFLARDGADLSQPALVVSEALRNYDTRAVNVRSGYAALNISLNGQDQRTQQCLNFRNGFLDVNLNRVEVSSVQQVNDRAFYKRGQRWVDSALLDKANESPRRVVEIGSEEFRRLAHRLAEQGRQGCVALNGEILLNVDGEAILVR